MALQGGDEIGVRSGFKILIGASGTMLLAWLLHGPLGQGHAFVTDLGARSAAALAGQGLDGVEVAYPDAPYMRTAQLSGAVAPTERDKAVRLVRALGGTAGAVWSDTRANMVVPGRAGAVASASGPPADAAVSGITSATPAPAEPAQGPGGTTAVASPPPPPVMAGSCQQAVDAALAGRVVQFRSGSAWLNPEARRIIADVAGALRPCRGYTLDVAALGTGNRIAHRAMALERADRVRAVLIEEGLPAAAITVRGTGTVRHIGFTVMQEGA
jgi:OOP family OmpA-OmpF porin